MSVTATTIITGSALLLAGSVIAAFVRSRRVGLAVQACGLVACGVAGICVLTSGVHIGATFHDTLRLSLGMDTLSAFFVAATALVAVPATVFATGYLADDRSGTVVSALTGLFIASLLLVVLARDPVTFLAGWELMTVIPAATILIDAGSEASARHAAFVYLGMTHIAGAGVWVTILMLAHAGALSGAHTLAHSLQLPVLVATLIGFGAKAGLMPLHSWLPRAHPAAPSHISAVMSGMMVKVALYGLIRVLFEWAAPAPQWIGLTLLAVGALSAVGGILYALMQQDLKRLLAFSSIENVGIVVLALSASILFARSGNTMWAGVAFVAGLFHIVNHALCKSLLFLGAGAIQHAVGHLEINRLGGLLGRMPRTGGAFLVGAIAIAGVPPLNGFASEWLTLQSLLHLVSGSNTPTALAVAVGAALLAATAALAVFCFVKIVGLVLLGPPRTTPVDHAREAGPSMTIPMASLAVCCIAFGLVPGLILHVIASASPYRVTEPVAASIRFGATSQYPALALATALVLLIATVRTLRTRSSVNAGPVWACGQLITPQLRWTSPGFSKALRLVLEFVLRPERDVTTTVEAGVVQSIAYSGAVPHLFDTHFVEPIVRLSNSGGRFVRRLQSGSLAAYVGYLVTLLVGALLAARFLGAA